MSATKSETVIIDVTRGDCLEANRKKGKSNTGTYFVCSSKDFEGFKEYFNDENVYIVDLEKVRQYSLLFAALPEQEKNEYGGKTEKFSQYSAYLTSLEKYPTVKVTLRINDSRVFMRFEDNADNVVKAFRNLLYEDVSSIELSKKGKAISIYPVFTGKLLENSKNAEDTGLVVDE